MPRKGRLVQPRHIVPWVAAPYIEMLRILWRIERFFFLPIRYLRAWTVSAIFGVIGVFFSVALFIPKLTQTEVQASPGVSRRDLFETMPLLREEDLALPSNEVDLSVTIQRMHVKHFDQNEWVTTVSKPRVMRTSSSAPRDAWVQHQFRQEDAVTRPLDSYVGLARVGTVPRPPALPEYSGDPGVGDSGTQAAKNPTLLIEKSVPRSLSQTEPLTYIIYVTNNGQEPVETATVEEFVSDIQRVVDCDPPALVSADQGHLIWDLTQLQPGETRHLRVTIQPDQTGPITQDTLVSFTSAPVIAETMVRDTFVEPPANPTEPEPVVPEIIPEADTQPTIPGQPKLVLEFDPPSAVQVGEELEAYYTVTNVGTADATGIRLLVEVPVQLRHRFGELVEHKISRLTPNESRRALFAALAEGSGRLPLNWTLEANELDSQSDSQWLAVLPGPTPLPTKSSIPESEPTLVDDSVLPTPLEALPLGHRTAPGSEDILPNTPTSQPPLHKPSSIPTWNATDVSPESNPLFDPESTQPIDPELTPEEPPLRNHHIGIEPPPDLIPLETESDPAPFPSTVPLDGLPAGGVDGVTEQ